MVSRIVERLVEIESALRALREEIVVQAMESERKNITQIDMSSLEEITPPAWLEIFSKLTLSAPTPIPRYNEMLPGLLLGYAETDSGAVLMEQQPNISNDSEMAQSLNIWLANPMSWITIELIIPQDIANANPDLYFGWTGTFNVSQKVQIDTLRIDDANNVVRHKISQEVVPSVAWSDLKPVHLAKNENIRVTRLLFIPMMNVFQSVRFDSFRLYRPKSLFKPV